MWAIWRDKQTDRLQDWVSKGALKTSPQLKSAENYDFQGGVTDVRMDGQTNGRTYRPTDTPSFRNTFLVDTFKNQRESNKMAEWMRQIDDNPSLEIAHWCAQWWRRMLNSCSILCLSIHPSVRPSIHPSVETDGILPICMLHTFLFISYFFLFLLTFLIFFKDWLLKFPFNYFPFLKILS